MIEVINALYARFSDRDFVDLCLNVDDEIVLTDDEDDVGSSVGVAEVVGVVRTST